MKKRGFVVEHKRDENHYLGVARLTTEQMIPVEDDY